MDGAVDSLLWSTGETTPSIEVSEGGNYSVMVFNQCGMGEAAIEVQAVAPAVTINSTGNLCVDSTATLSLNIQGVADSIVWNTGEHTPTIEVSELNTYSVMVFNQCGMGEASFEIKEVLPIAQIEDIVGNPCIDNQVMLKVTPQFSNSILWDNQATTNTINVTEIGTYSVEVFNHCGSDIATIDIPEILPEVTLNPLDSVCFGGETVFSFMVNNANPNNFTWFQDNILLENETIDTLVATEEGLYKIVIANNCGTGEMEHEVACTFEGCVQVPNVFTPNGDRTNDEFFPVIKSECNNVVTIQDMRIYNRWGQLVFETTTEEAWDGQMDGKLAPSDVYIYYIETFNSAPTQGDGVEVFKGDVTLVR